MAKTKWNVAVKKDKNSHLSLKSTTISEDNKKITLNVTASINAVHKDENFEYSNAYKLYYYDGKKWKLKKFADDYSFDANLTIFPVDKGSKKKTVLKYILKSKDFQNCNFEKGFYKLVCDTGV